MKKKWTNGWIPLNLPTPTTYDYAYRIIQFFSNVVRTPPGFIHQENERISYYNATIQFLCCNIIFIKMTLKIDCYDMITCHDKNIKHFAYHYQHNDFEGVTDLFW